MSTGAKSPAMPAPAWPEIIRALAHPAVLVGALGYFVDIYDLVLFGVLRVPSLTSLGYAHDQLVTTGTWLLNWQMAGMLLGGLLWGLLGDARGRLSILFGSIVLYSLANLANGFVHDLTGYTLCRVFAGIGLAGELGGSIALVSEVLPRSVRGYGTMMVSAIGVLGAVVAGAVGQAFAWRTAFFVGGGMGLTLLVLRLTVRESHLFARLAEEARPRFGSQLWLLAQPRRLGRYLCCILIGLPCWYVIGLVIFLSPEFAAALGATQRVTAGTAIAVGYIGISLGDLLSGGLCQVLRGRRRVLLIFILATLVLFNVLFFHPSPTAHFVYGLCFLLGIAVGYWAVFVTVAAEHFGTNLRATVTTTVPNVARGALIPITSLYLLLKAHGVGVVHSALIVGWLAIVLALIGLYGLRETFSDELDYAEK